MAYKLQKHCTNVEHVIYEKDSDIGGVWLQNRLEKSVSVLFTISGKHANFEIRCPRYPGVACDIPSHAYVRYHRDNVFGNLTWHADLSLCTESGLASVFQRVRR